MTDRRQVDGAILDATCGGRMMWFDKDRDDVVFLDQRALPEGSIPQQPNWSVEPDVIASFTDMPFEDCSFSLVVFDPPHAKIMSESIIGLKYGTLVGDWKPVLEQGLRECWRVTKPGGTMIFKWAETHVSVGDVLALVPDIPPAFGHVTAKSGKTIWVTFYKPESQR